MERISAGIVLTRSESHDIREVCDIVCRLRETVIDEELSSRPVSVPLLNETDQMKARWLEAHAEPKHPDQEEVLIEAEYHEDVRAVAELVIANTLKVVNSLCTPSIPDGYYSSWRPSAFRVIAMVAELSEEAEIIRQQSSID